MSALLIILFLTLVGGIYVTIGRLVVPRPLRAPLLDDLGPAFARGVRAMYHTADPHTVDRTAAEAPLRAPEDADDRTPELAGARR